MSTNSSSGGRKYEWLVVVPDFPDALQKRLAVRPDHFANLGKWRDTGLWKFGGATLEEVPKDDEASSLKFTGSTLIVVAESKQEILDMLKQDIYARKEVWDVEKAQMWPIKTAFRDP